MGFELNGGSLYVMKNNDEPVLFGENVYGVAEFEMSADETPQVLYALNSSASASFEMKFEHLDLINNLFGNPLPTGNFTLQYQLPIMIQARWHKKARIRKKWLKRFGMKPDTVTVLADANMLEYSPGYSLDDNNSIYTTCNSFEFETNKQEYVLRPDQKRRGLEIQF